MALLCSIPGSTEDLSAFFVFLSFLGKTKQRNERAHTEERHHLTGPHHLNSFIHVYTPPLVVPPSCRRSKAKPGVSKVLHMGKITGCDYIYPGLQLLSKMYYVLPVNTAG